MVQKSKIVGRKAQRDDVKTAAEFIRLNWPKWKIIDEMKRRGLNLKNSERAYRRAKREVRRILAQRIT